MANILRPDNKYAYALSPQAMAKAAAQYHRQDRLPPQLKSKDAFATYTRNRIKNVDSFAGIKMPDNSGKTLAEKLQAAASEASSDMMKEDVAKLKASLSKALRLSPRTTTTQENFEQEIAKINASLPQGNASSIASRLQEFRHTASRDLDAQHQSEITQLTQLFEVPDSEFVKQLKSTCQLSTQGQVDAFKAEMLSTLQKSQAEEKKKLDATLESEVKDLHQGAENETNRLGYLHYLYTNNAETKKEIDKLARENREKRQRQGKSAAAFSGRTTLYDIFDDVNVAELGKNNHYVKTPTGDIQISHDEKGNTVNVIELPPFLFNLLYYIREEYREVLNGLAMKIMSELKPNAEGPPRIELNINLPRDEEYALKLGREAYLAALAAGFDPTEPADAKDKKNITIIVNGKEKTEKELFEGQPTLLAEAKAAAAKEKTIRDTYNKPTNKTTPGLDAQVKLKQENLDNRHRFITQNQTQPTSSPGAPSPSKPNP